MILKDLITETNAILDHNPGIDVHENNVIRILVRHYEQLSSQHAWLFLVKRVEQTLYATVTGTAAATVQHGAASKTVVGTGTAFHDGMEGQLYVGPDGVSNRVSAVLSTTQLYLVDDYAGTPIAGSADWSVTFDRVPLPRDCVDYLGITDRVNERRFLTLDARSEENLFLDRTASGDCYVAIENYAAWEHPRDMNPALAVNATASDLLDGDTYEYVFVREVEGREGSPSQVYELATTAANPSVAITGLPIPWPARYNIYRRSKTKKTGWYYIDSLEPNVLIAGTYTDSGTVSDYTRPLQDVGPTMYLRVADLPSTDLVVELRYMRRPNRLSGVEQAPEWPPQYHQILVWKAAAELLMGSNMKMSQIYDRRADGMLDQMRKRYLERRDRIHRFGPMTADAGFAPYRYGIPTKT